MEHQISNSALIKSTLFALVLAAVLSVFVILPAEYGIDPTGVGKSLGFTRLSETSEEAEAVVAKSGSQTEFETITITVPAGRGVEYKFFMEQNQSLQYSWYSDGGSLYYDLHGEPEGDTTGYFLSYTVAENEEVKGSFVAPFAGSHGWYWKNKTEQDVDVQLMVKGKYTIIGLKR